MPTVKFQSLCVCCLVTKAATAANDNYIDGRVAGRRRGLAHQEAMVAEVQQPRATRAGSRGLLFDQQQPQGQGRVDAMVNQIKERSGHGRCGGQHA
jgi:hypothetical protein